MLTFVWKISDSLQQLCYKIRSTEKLRNHIKVSFLGKFVFLMYISSIETEVEFNRGTVHHVRHIAFCAGKLKSVSSESFVKGIGLIDLPQKFLFVALVLFGAAWATESLITGIGWGAVFYVIYTLVTYSKNKEILMTIHTLLNS